MPFAEYRSTCEISVLASDLSEGSLFSLLKGRKLFDFCQLAGRYE